MTSVFIRLSAQAGFSKQDICLDESAVAENSRREYGGDRQM